MLDLMSMEFIQVFVIALAVSQTIVVGAICHLYSKSNKTHELPPPATTVMVKGQKYVLASAVDERLNKSIIKEIVKPLKQTKGADLEFLNRKPKNKVSLKKPEPTEEKGIPWYERPDS
jgi:ribosomal protein L23